MRSAPLPVLAWQTRSPRAPMPGRASRVQYKSTAHRAVRRHRPVTAVPRISTIPRYRALEPTSGIAHLRRQLSRSHPHQVPLSSSSLRDLSPALCGLLRRTAVRENLRPLLVALELRRALLHESAIRPLEIITLHGLGLFSRFVVECLVYLHRPLIVQTFLGNRVCSSRALTQRSRQLQRFGLQSLRSGHSREKAPSLRLLSLDCPPGEEEVGRPAESDYPWQNRTCAHVGPGETYAYEQK